MQQESTKQLAEMVEAKIHKLRQQSSWQIDGAFVMDESFERQRTRNHCGRDLGGLALLALQIKKSDLTPDHLAAMQQIVDDIAAKT